MNGLLRRLLMLWVRFKIRPENAAELVRGCTHPLCYVLEWRSISDLAVLQAACERLQLPRPARSRPGPRALSYFYLSRPRRFWSPRPDRRPPPQLKQMIGALRADPAADFCLVPVSIYWGRAPQHEASWWRLLLAEDWVLTSRLRKSLQVLVNGRDTLVEFDAPLSLRELLGAELAATTRGWRVARSLHALYARRRAVRIGPDLSHRRTIVNAVLRTRAVRAAVTQELRAKHLSRRKVMLRARAYALEIAANYSHVFVRFMEHALAWLWTRLYDGVEFGHAATLEQVAEGHELIYVPCHRSHMDYLLLSYAIYVQGFAVPHVAGGVNLNLPVIGRFLRKGGAFFIRRTLRGNTLYTVVLMKYLATIMARGHPIEYFIEGGRSRTGRLLQPKTGMLSMTVRGFLHAPVRPVVFIPVYFGYERLVEGRTYLGELSGQPKEKESVLGLLEVLARAARALRQGVREPRRADRARRHPGSPPRAVARRTLCRGCAQPLGGPRGGCARAGHHAQHQLRRRGDTHQSLALTLLAMPRQALPEADARAPARAVPLAPDRLPATASASR